MNVPPWPCCENCGNFSRMAMRKRMGGTAAVLASRLFHRSLAARASRWLASACAPLASDAAYSASAALIGAEPQPRSPHQFRPAAGCRPTAILPICMRVCMREARRGPHLSGGTENRHCTVAFM